MFRKIFPLAFALVFIFVIFSLAHWMITNQIQTVFLCFLPIFYLVELLMKIVGSKYVYLTGIILLTVICVGVQYFYNKRLLYNRRWQNILLILVIYIQTGLLFWILMLIFSRVRCH